MRGNWRVIDSLGLLLDCIANSRVCVLFVEIPVRINFCSVGACGATSPEAWAFTRVLSNPVFAHLQLLLKQHRQKRPRNLESSRNQLRVLAMLRWHWCLFLVWIATLSSVISQEEDEMPDDQDISEEAMSPEQLRALHAKFDQNGDGKVSLSEVLDFARHMSKAIAGKDVSAILEEIDTDKDGNLPELSYSLLSPSRVSGLGLQIEGMRPLGNTHLTLTSLLNWSPSNKQTSELLALFIFLPSMPFSWTRPGFFILFPPFAHPLPSTFSLNSGASVRKTLLAGTSQ